MVVPSTAVVYSSAPSSLIGDDVLLCSVCEGSLLFGGDGCWARAIIRGRNGSAVRLHLDLVQSLALLPLEDASAAVFDQLTNAVLLAVLP